MEALALAVAATTLAATLQGVTGFGAGLISMSLLSMIWTVPRATATLSPVSVLLTVSLIAQQRQHVDLRLLRPLLLGLPFGLALGILGLERAPEAALKGALGLLLLAAVISGLRQAAPRALPAWAGPLAGMGSAAASAALNAAGPPVLIYASLAGWERDRFRTTLALWFTLTSCLSLAGLSARGFVTAATLTESAVLVPGVLLGSVLGSRLGARLPQDRFAWLVRGLMLALALRFLGAAVG